MGDQEASQALVDMMSVDRHACDHHGVQARDHRCPQCRGIMRRCCDSLVGLFNHEPGCGTYEVPDDDDEETVMKVTVRPT